MAFIVSDVENHGAINLNAYISWHLRLHMPKTMELSI